MLKKGNKTFCQSFKFSIIVIVILVSIMAGCKVKGLVGKTDDAYMNVNKIIQLNRNNKEKIEKVWIKKIRGVYTLENEDLRFNSNIRIIKDSIIIVSITLDFGIEAIRLYVKKDSLTVLNRLNKTWYKGSVLEFKERYGLISEFDLLENILLMGMGDNMVSEISDRANWHTSDSGYCYIPVKTRDRREESFCYDISNGYLMQRKIVMPEDSISFFIRYSEYEEKDLLVLPTVLKVWFVRNKIEHRILLNYEKWEVNKTFPEKIKISGSYKRVRRLIDL